MQNLIGSWTVDVDGSGKKSCQGLSTDFSTVIDTTTFKDSCENGSTAYCIDTQQVYMYSSYTRTWIAQN